MPEISGLSHSSKKTRGREGNCLAASRIVSSPRSSSAASALPLRLAADDAREHANHLQDVCDRALVEREDRQPALDELRRDAGLQIGERQDQIGLERFDFFEARGDERRDFRLGARFRRAQRVARDADHTMAFAEQIERLGRLFGQTDDALRIRRQRRTHRDRRPRQPRWRPDD